jgi:hypothetical protein
MDTRLSGTEPNADGQTDLSGPGITDEPIVDGRELRDINEPGSDRLMDPEVLARIGREERLPAEPKDEV